MIPVFYCPAWMTSIQDSEVNKHVFKTNKFAKLNQSEKNILIAPLQGAILEDLVKKMRQMRINEAYDTRNLIHLDTELLKNEYIHYDSSSYEKWLERPQWTEFLTQLAHKYNIEKENDLETLLLCANSLFFKRCCGYKTMFIGSSWCDSSSRQVQQQQQQQQQQRQQYHVFGSYINIELQDKNGTKEIDNKLDEKLGENQKRKYSICYMCGTWCPMKCSQFELVAYCSKSCQKQHWKQGHKEICFMNKLSKVRNTIAT